MSASRHFVGLVGWVASSYLVSQVLRFIQAIVVARWLGPNEMGLYAYVYAILALVDLLEKIGADQVFIARSPSEHLAESDWLMGCWNMRAVLAGCVGLVTLLIAGGVDAFGDNARLASLLVLLSPIPALMAVRSARIMLMQKRQLFAPLARFEIAAAFIRTTLPLCLVYFFRTVEWLVIANVMSAVAIAILSHVIFPIKHALRMKGDVVRELYFYGKNNIVISSLTVAHTTFDNIAVGRFIGQAVLGVYSMGYRLAMTPFTLIQSVANRILVPQYRAAFDGGLSALTNRWRAAFQFLVLVYSGLFGLVIVLADYGVELLFEPSWTRMSTVIVFASFVAFFRGAALSISPLLIILRAPHIDARLKGVEVAVFLSFVALGSLLGVFEIFLWGGIISYLGAFLMRSIWWHQTLTKEGLLGMSQGDIGHLFLAVAVLLCAVIARSAGIGIATSVLLLLLVVAGPLVLRANAFIKEFAE